jgi:hypothetical protein
MRPYGGGSVLVTAAVIFAEAKWIILLVIIGLWAFASVNFAKWYIARRDAKAVEAERYWDANAGTDTVTFPTQRIYEYDGYYPAYSQEPTEWYDYE